ncbi:MAG: glycosyltransferase family 4 protein [Patescibacteria group bacterium]
MKVCFITNRLVYTDGFGRSSISIIKELQKKGIEVVVLLTAKAPDSDFKEVKQYPVLQSMKNNKIKWLNLILDLLKVKSIVKDCDLIHCEIEPFAPLAWLLAKFYRKPYFLMVHGTFAVKPLKVWYLKSLYIRSYRLAKKIFCNSNYTQQRLLQAVSLKNTEVIGRGVNLEEFASFNQPVTKDLASKIILSVGIIKRRKGYHISIPAVAEVAKKYPNLKYLIVGWNSNDGYFSELQDLIKKNNLTGKVEFKDHLSEAELVKLYFQADIFLLTPVNYDNRFEGLGMVYLEANAAGLPVIGTYDCGAQDAIKDGENGLLVPQNDVSATALAILKLLDNPPLATQLGQNGKKMVSSISWENVVSKIIENYLIIIKEKI